MDEKRKRAMSHKRRIRNLTSLCGLSAIILAVSTYAWFTGLQDVSVGTFQVEIAAADSMQLSLNGQDWSESLTFTKDDLTTKSYSATSFNWPSNGLVPVSSIGDMDSTSSRMVMYEKASMTTTPGGYRLIANKVANTIGDYEGVQGQNGFLAFDLFIKNFSGTAYFTENNEANEEAIYLTPDSKVSIGSSGIASSGIQNSVRVAFAQIGRVSAFNNTASQITGITCSDAGSDTSDTSYVTGICRKAQIWEPNDTKHVATAINWYTKSCKKRTAADLVDASYTGTCNTVADGNYYNTYAIAKEINATDKVDVYDGRDYNSYETSITNGSLKAVDYFTDTEKNLKGVSRPTFMTLAPASITKVRVYVYIEGQDIDNFDYASAGQQIQVNFGFTKQRFTSDDVGVTEGELYNNLPTAVHPTASR